MPDSPLRTLPDLERLLLERQQLWEGLADSMGRSAELEKLAAHIPAHNPAWNPIDSAGPLTSRGLPPDELAAALRMVKESLTKMQDLDHLRQQKEDEVQRIKTRDNLIIGAVVIAVLVILLKLLAGIW
jgi:hypothetical protein